MSAATTVLAQGAAQKITPPSIEYSSLSPMLILFGVALAGVLVDAFAPPKARRVLQPLLAGAGFIGAFVAVVLLHAHRQVLAAGAVAIDGPTLFLQGTILVFALLAVLLVAERRLDSSGGALVASAAIVPGSRGSTAQRTSPDVQTEAYPLMVFSVSGMLLFVASNNLLVMFVALEILSLPLYLLCGLARRRRLLSQEAAMKYFLLGAFSSAFFLYGVAFAYGYAGSVELGRIADAVGTVGQNDTYLYLSLALLGVGLFFKIGAAPFHSWTPDVYQGAPTPITAFMAAGTKVAAFGALLRVFYVAFGGMRWDWRPVIWAVAILTMVVGAVLALTQRDIKRMLAYSAVAHAGFLLVGMAGSNVDGLRGAMFYLVTYGFTTIAAFAVVSLVRTGDGEASDLSQWQGLGRTSPLLAGTFAFLLLALAGIPLTSGFTGKFAVFQAAIAGDATPLVVVALVCSAIAAFFYVRVIVLMFFSEPLADGPVVVTRPTLTFATVGIGALMTLLLGVAPQPLLDLATTAATSGFVR
ncbi:MULTISPECIES: NADH-quinone oxidoreductase subunit NuoN [unclassified Parafrankia]|uniref:NADH-quinone oxidoreductase subunit NuoN n=1 Tax=Parafrankia TaxID=2994362 RepID=UPI000DA432D1|nr:MULTISPECIES: NADH-quinone oxidoreductase subunit NuoN [unclassified Parafrankia]TCJ37850.1 NADH-quinone oxidoreductase subunit NuoN [Parafrankia sp. BMG5.11]CAI7975611.1 NADH-quinone oxidoreductase subunit N [Frankia sp. Hr75.2]SQD94680.1 NADH-quinone oxidoreductase subunit N [Parafrankia sp. Ea1.12]